MKTKNEPTKTSVLKMLNELGRDESRISYQPVRDADERLDAISKKLHQSAAYREAEIIRDRVYRIYETKRKAITDEISKIRRYLQTEGLTPRVLVMAKKLVAKINKLT